MAKNKNKKALTIDSSAVRPFVFAEKNLSQSSKIAWAFAQNVGFNSFISSAAFSGGEFSFSYSPQQSIFTSPIMPSFSSPQRGFSISLSDSGYFSLTAGDAAKFSTFQVSVASTDVSGQGTLWESSLHWNFLSPQDRNVITLALEKKEIYDEVAILTNDWHLRQQCLNFEGISTYGSCSMLAGMVLTGFLSYQKGTYVYLGWQKEEPRWIPSDKDRHRKLNFKEVLAIERSRIDKGNSFWVT